MTMRVLYGAAPEDIAGYDTERLRAAFLVDDLFAPDTVRFVYTHVDRLLLGGAVPVADVLAFGSGSEIGTAYLLSAREMGMANLGGSGTVTVDGQRFGLDNRDVLYIGRGAREIALASASAEAPARFYMNSVPAGADLPHRLITKGEAKPLDLGEGRRANDAASPCTSIRKLRRPACCYGHHRPRPGSVWNTMPPHLHERRMEAYLLFRSGAGRPRRPPDGPARRRPAISSWPMATPCFRPPGRSIWAPAPGLMPSSGA